MVGVPRILILGGYGLAGAAIAEQLLRETPVRVVLAGRTLSKAEESARRLNLQFGGDRVSAVRADASDARSLRSAFAGTDLVVVASPTTKDTATVAREALLAEADYLDIQLAVGNKLDVLTGLDGEIRAAGRCFITEAGFHPGLPAALVRYLAGSFDRLDRGVVAALLNVGGSLTYTESVGELLEVFADYRGEVYRGGRWRAVSWLSLRDTPRIDFGPPFGKRYTAPMMFEEIRAMPVRYPSLQETGVYAAGFNWVADFLVTPLLLASLAVSRERASGPMGRLYLWAVRTFSSPPYGVVLKAEGRGIQDGRPKTLNVYLSHENGYVFTAIPVVACLLQYLDGSARRPGLWMMGQAVDPVRLMKDMARMGIRVREEVL